MEPEDMLVYKNSQTTEIVVGLLVFGLGVFGVCCWLGYLGEASRGDGYGALVVGVFLMLGAAAVLLMVGTRSLEIDNHAKTVTYRVKKIGVSEQVTIRRFSDVEVVEYLVIAGGEGDKVARITLRMNDKTGFHLPCAKVPETKSIAREIAATIGTKMQDMAKGGGLAENPF